MDNNDNNLISQIINIRGIVTGSNTLLIVFSIFLPLLIIIVVFFAAFGANFDSDGANTGRYSGNGVVCAESGFTIDKTSLTKNDFVEKLTNYASQNGMDSVFSEYAGNIYDKSKDKNINPELVIVRAIAESQGKSQTGNFNYWGINCSNTGGGKDCESFNSFMDGVDRFLELVSKYDSLSDLMMKYSFIGTYWYNPGSPGIGGCYYAKSIYGDNIPARVKSACQKDCTVGNTKNCIETTEQEQKDYSDWQVKTNMASIRKAVFGLEASDGVICTGSNGNLATLTNYNLGHEGLNVLDRSLSDAERADLDNYIDSQIAKAGYGTGAGVAAAGQSLIYWFEQKGWYLQYRWGGGHSYYTNTSCGGDSSTFIFSNPYWGAKCGSDENHSHRVYFGMDCSGFVSWATRTACKTNFNNTSGYWSEAGKIISLSEAKPGDIMDKVGHVRLIVKNTGDGVIAAEEAGEPLSGLVFKKYTSAGGYNIVNMQDWYASNCDRKGK